MERHYTGTSFRLFDLYLADMPVKTHSPVALCLAVIYQCTTVASAVKMDMISLISPVQILLSHYRLADVVVLLRKNCWLRLDSCESRSLLSSSAKLLVWRNDYRVYVCVTCFSSTSSHSYLEFLVSFGKQVTIISLYDCCDG